MRYFTRLTQAQQDWIKTEAERARLKKDKDRLALLEQIVSTARLPHLEDWGLQDAFRLLHQEDKLYTYWDYRAGDFHQHRGMRIDLALATKPLADAATFALIDRFARKGKSPSDHAPMLVDFDL